MLKLQRRLALATLCVAAALALVACQSAPAPAPPAPKAAAPAATAAPAQPAAAKEVPAPTKAPAAAAAPAAPAVEQKMTVGIGALPKALDPILESGTHANAVWWLIYDSLVRMDDQGNLQPGLAESWSTPNDKTWQFKLRKGVKFHNGEPFNAEAAKFTLDRVRDKAKSVWASRFDLVDRVDVVDEYTINIITREPFALMAKTTYVAAILPPAYIKGKGDAGFNAAPVGTGPFKVKEWKQDSFVTVEANPDYWDGAPRMKSITIRTYPEASTLVAAVEKGEIDVAYNVPPDDAKRLQDKGLNIVSRPLGNTMVLLLRSPAGTPLDDKRVRQAINHAIDKRAIVDKLMGGYGKVADGQIAGQGAFGYNPNVKAYPYDPAKAKALLAEAGHPNGFKVKMSGVAGRWVKDKELSEAIAAQLTEVGIQVELEILESAVWYQLYLKGGSGPIVLNNMAWAPMMDAEQGLQIFLSPDPRSILKSSAFDAAYRKQQTILDPKEREKALFDMVAVTHEEAPVAFMFQLPGLYALNKKVQGLDFTGFNAMKNLTKVFIQ